MCVDWVQILSDFRVRQTRFHFQYIQPHKKASFRSPCTSAVSQTRAVKLRKVDEIRIVHSSGAAAGGRLQSCSAGSTGSSAGSRSSTCAMALHWPLQPEGCGHTASSARQFRLCLRPLSCDTSFLKLLSALYPVYCPSVLTEKWCQRTQTG